MFFIGESQASTEQSFSRTRENFRRRKNYFECTRSQIIRNQNLIKMHAEYLSRFCKSIGLKLDEIILSPNNEEMNESDTKITIFPNRITNDYKIFKCLMAKDLTNLSCRNYSLFKQTLIHVHGYGFPNINKILNIQIF